jgi:hypothetical protein
MRSLINPTSSGKKGKIQRHRSALVVTHHDPQRHLPINQFENDYIIKWSIKN